MIKMNTQMALKRSSTCHEQIAIEKRRKSEEFCIENNDNLENVNDSLCNDLLLKTDDTLFSAINLDNIEQDYWTSKTNKTVRRKSFLNNSKNKISTPVSIKKRQRNVVKSRSKKWFGLSLRKVLDGQGTSKKTDNKNETNLSNEDLNVDIQCSIKKNLKLPSCSSLKIIEKNTFQREESVDLVNSDDEFADEASRFYESPLVLQQIENVISKCDTPNSTKFGEPSKFTLNLNQNKNSNSQISSKSSTQEEPNLFSSSFDSSTSNNSNKSSSSRKSKGKLVIKAVINKIKEDEDNWNETIANDISEFFKSSQYKREVASAFDNLETTICQISEGQDMNLQKDASFSQSFTNNIEWNDESMLNLNFNTQNLLKNDKNNTPLDSSVLRSTQVVELGPFYGLPTKVKDLIEQYKGIEKLYDWQDECLNLEAIKNRKNLVYALPTSGGKTLVSEILIFREILCRKHNVIFVLPYVSIVQEKVWALSPFAIALDFLVEEYAAGKGSYPPRKRRHKHSVYVATIEKALGIINSLIELKRLHEIGLVVVDELHLLGEPKRGVTLEIFLTKLMHSKANIHIVGMSATIGNLSEVCEFLKAEVYTKDFRPVELKEYVKCENNIAEVNRNASTLEESLTPVRTVDFQYSEANSKLDPDKITGLVLEVIPAGSCLVFCPSKKNCENVATLLCRILSKKFLEHRKVEKDQILKMLHAEGTLCPILRRTLPYGIAYHHSGLTSDERRIIEDSFRAGILCVICCTSTLAAGVNLPAQRVILRSPYIGKEFINLSRYKQMIGRAGRAGLGEIGESILLCERRDLKKVTELLCSPMDQVVSKMCDSNLLGFRNLILSCIGLETATTRQSLRGVSSCTLLAVQENRLEKNVYKATDEAIINLFKMGALQLASDKSSVPNKDVSILLQTSTDIISSPVQLKTNEENKENHVKLKIHKTSELVISKLGKAAIKGSFDLETAHIVYEDLLQAQYSLVLLSCLHLLYLVTPYELAKQMQPSLSNYYSVYSELNEKELQTAKVLGLNEACEAAMLAGRRLKSVNERVFNRFYLTLILHDLWNEKQVFEVAEKYQVSRGIVQQLMVASATFASNLIRFCEELDEFWAFVDLLRGMSHRLQHCASKELLPLMDLPSVKQARARQLYKAGFKTLQSVAKANPNDLVNNIENMSRRIANQLIASAKLLLLERVENLREEAEDVLDGIDIVT